MPNPRNRLQWQATCKVYPAIADLQAISDFVRIQDFTMNINADPYHLDMYTVPAGKIFILGFIQATCAQADPTEVRFVLRSGLTDYAWYIAPYGAASELHDSTLKIVYDETETVRITWIGGLAATDVFGLLFGQLFTKY